MGPASVLLLRNLPYFLILVVIILIVILVLVVRVLLIVGGGLHHGCESNVRRSESNFRRADLLLLGTLSTSRGETTEN
jgi:hypothetical protein